MKTQQQFSTLIDVLRYRAIHQAEQTAFVFLEDGEIESRKLTYQELDLHARVIAVFLQSIADIGERAILLYPPGLDFITAFLGCLYAGVIAVPVPQPKRNRHNNRLESIVKDSEAKLALTTTSVINKTKEIFEGNLILASLQCVTTDNINNSNKVNNWQPPQINSNTLAFLQYTSGSTGTPKGVMVSHGNLLSTSADLDRGWVHTSESVMVTWLPTFHDMGLIYGVLQPLYKGFPAYMMAPVTFLQKPYLWLKTISRLRATHSAAPNFAYELCVRKVSPKQRVTLDLSSWRTALNGAEPVRADVLEQFAETYKSCGFDKIAFCPGYGLAEATLKVSAVRKAELATFYKVESEALEQNQIVEATEPHQNVRTLVGCGYSEINAKIVIVNPKTLIRSAPEEVGEIWVSSSSVAQGYWKCQKETEKTFYACLKATELDSNISEEEGSFLRTGDLGFLKDGELFITGRIKDVIIIRGQNHYPQDIEQTVEKSHPSLRPNCGAAFSVEVEGVEKLVIVQEVKRTYIRKLSPNTVTEAINRCVSLEHELAVNAVVLLKPGSIPKTSSGKLQRSLCRNKFLEGSLNLIAQDRGAKLDISGERKSTDSELSIADANAIQYWLVNQIAKQLNVATESIDPHKSFVQLGFDSLKTIEVQGFIQNELRINLPMQTFIGEVSIEDLVRLMQEKLDLSESSPIPLTSFLSVALNQRHQPFPLTDIQQAYWLGRSDFFELGNIATHIYVELEAKDLSIQPLNISLQSLIERHEMLRAVVLPDGQQQILQEVPPYQIGVLDLREQDDAEINLKLQSLRQELSHQVLPTDQWPLFEIRATRLKDCTRLHISFDALYADASSIKILAREWAQLYHTPKLLLPSLKLSFRDYVITEQRLKNSEIYQRSQDYWFSRFDALPAAPDLPLACHPSSLTRPQFKRHSYKLNLQKWKQLKQRASEMGLTPSGILLAAFTEILTTWSVRPQFTINLTLFNRLPIHPQVNSIVGDFTSLLLLEVDNSAAKSFVDSAQRIQKQLWRDLEHRHIGGVRVLRELARYHGDRNRATMPIVFTSTIGLDSQTQNDLQPEQQIAEVIYSITQTPQVWIDHQVHEQMGALAFNWDVVEELFPTGLIDDMFSAYCYLLEELASSERAWTNIHRKLIPASHLSQRAEVNATAVAMNQVLLHELFINQVEKHAGQYAIISPQGHLSYRELYERANEIGYKLRELGAIPNALVAIVMEKGWEQVVAVLAVSISGAAYLPIDPTLSPERLQYLLEQGEVQVALTQSWLKEALQWPSDIHLLCLDAEEDWKNEDTIPLLKSVQTSEDLAYVIYTSGSTGLPKGVMIDHRGAVNTVQDINQRFNVSAQDRVLALSALNFDLSVYDIFGLLAVGGTIVIPSESRGKDPSHWLDLAKQHHITLWNSVPTSMQIVVEYLAGHPESTPSSLRLCLLSGDWVPLNLPEQMKALWSNIQIISLGGATEASIWSIYYPIEKVQPNWKSIPYGRPLTNQYFHVLNHLNEHCPIWVPGQLYIGGIGLARGYWRDEDRSKESFLTHTETNEILYKTGDLGRYLPDGNIEFLGREDFQVKINGYRIELGEIEAALEQHLAVKQAVVTTANESRERKRLLAYVVLNHEFANVNQSWSSHKIVEAHKPRQLEGVILDPIERIEFKLKQLYLQQYRKDQSRIQLSKPDFGKDFLKTYLERRSYRKFLSEPIPLKDFSQFISCLLHLNLDGSPLPKYQYPSAGSLYPVQAFLYIKSNSVQGLESGLYYYHPSEHSLVLISEVSQIDNSVYGENQLVFQKSSFSLFLVGQLNAITPIYGELAKDFCLLEAGYIGQLLMSVALESRIGLCPIGFLDFQELRCLLKLEPSQILLHSFVGGHIDPAWSHLLKPQSNIKANSASASLEVQLQKHLQQKLPHYMVPASYVILDAFPLTPNGKLDRRSLPVPNVHSINDETERFVAPHTDTEKVLASVCADILGIEEVKINVYSNFFKLGGDSLQATRFISQLRSVFKLEIPLRELFEKSNIISFAEYIDALRIKSQDFQDEREYMEAGEL